MSKSVFSRKTKVPMASLKPDRVYWVHEGQVIDLGTATLEDLKLTAYVTQEAKARLVGRKTTANTRTTSRVAAFCKSQYDRAKAALDI